MRLSSCVIQIKIKKCVKKVAIFNKLRAFIKKKKVVIDMLITKCVLIESYEKVFKIFFFFL